MNNRSKIKSGFMFWVIIVLLMLILQTRPIMSSEESTSRPLSASSDLARESGGGGARFLERVTESVGDLSKAPTSGIQYNQVKASQINNLNNSVTRPLKYDLKILEEFNQTNSTEVRVIVRLADNSNITIRGTKEERRELMRQKDEWFKSKTENFLSRLPEDKFNVLSNNSDGFVGMITKEAFDMLINDTKVSEVYLDTVGSIALDESVSWINVDDDVWNLGYTGEGINVCIIDSGVNAAHPDLSGKIAGEYCYCSSGGGCCPDSSSEDNDAEDDHGHGTHVAGIVASNDSQYRGVAYESKITAVRIVGSDGTGSEGDMSDGINWCRLNKDTYNISVITMSVNVGPISSGVCDNDVASSGSQRWLINYITSGESYVSAPNLTTAVYVLEITSKTSAQITDEVSRLINATKS